MKGSLRQEFNELVMLTVFLADYYNYSGIRDELDLLEYDEHIWDIQDFLGPDGAHPYPDYLACHVVERDPDFVPANEHEMKMCVANLKFDMLQNNKILEFEFNKFGAKKMTAKVPTPEDKFALQSAALKYGCINLLRLL